MFTIEKIPKCKCGAEAIGLAVLGGSSLLGTAATIATNESNQSYGSAESAAARKWSTNERLAAQEYSTKERLATQQYNSPQNQMSMLRAAGLNPNALGTGVSFVGSQPQSSALAASPMSGIGTSQVPNIPQLISSGSDLVNSLAKHEETKASLPLLGEQVKYYVEKTFGEQINNDLLQLERQFRKSTLPADIKSKFENLAKLQFEKVVAQQTGEKFKAETELIKAEKRVQDVLKNLKGEELIQAKYLTENWHRINNAMINLQNSEAAKNYASANEINTLLPDKKTAQILSNGLSAIDYDIKKLTEKDTIQQVEDEARRLRNMVEKGEVLGRYIPPLDKKREKINHSVYDDFEDGLIKLWRAYRRGVEQGISKSKK